LVLASPLRAAEFTTVKQLSSLPYFPFPADYPRCVPRNLMIAYLDRYAANFDLRFGETVHSVRRDRNAWFIEPTQCSISAPMSS
jgi:cation diffusion facilitator CzcD-associated flavoprotein CzcO